MIRRQSENQSQTTFHVTDVVREIRTVKDVVRSADGDTHLQRLRLVNDGVVENSTEIGAWGLLYGGAAGWNSFIATVKPSA